MARRALVRGGITAIAAFVLPFCAVPLSGQAHADTDASAEAVVPAGARYMPRTDKFITASAEGFLHQREGTGGYLWTSYDTGVTTEATPGTYNGTSSGAVAQFLPATKEIQLRDAATGAVRSTVQFTPGTWAGVFGAQDVMTYKKVTGSSTVVHLLRSEDGTTVERTVTGVDDFGTGSVMAMAYDAQGAVVYYYTGDGTTRHTAYIDFASATATPILQAEGVNPTTFVLSGDYIVGNRGAVAYALPRSDPSATAVQVTVPVVNGQPTLAVAGDWLLAAHYEEGRPGGSLTAISLKPGLASRTLLAAASSYMATGPDGSAVVAGGTDAEDWAVLRVRTGNDGLPSLEHLADLEPVPAQVYGLTLSAGRLVYATNTHVYQGLYRRDIAVTGQPTADDPKTVWSIFGTYIQTCSPSVACAKLQGLGNGRVAFVDAEGDGVHVPNATSANAYSAITLGSTGSQVLDGSGRYVIANGGSSAKQYIGDTGQGDATNVLKTRSVTAASVWGTQLWTVTSTSGQIVSTDLKTNKTAAPLATGAPCVPSELQAVGRWVYWSCGPTGVAGVYDRTAKKSTAVPSGEALVGDGYLVRHDTTNGKLVLTDFHSGTAATRDLADLPKGALDDDRGITWSVDKYGGDVAYADAQQRIHIIAPGVSTQNLAALESRTDPGVDRATPYGPIWGSWQLSKPASGWKLAVRDSLGRTVDTVTGGVTRGDLVAEWDGRTSTGALAPNGSYTWTLTAQPADGTGPALVRTGKATFYKGAAVRHDFGRDGIGDLLTLNSSGGLSIQYGSATGTFDGKRTGTGWPASSLVVPFGDTNGDECNDVLVRSGSGTLTRYNGGCGSALKPSTTHVKLGTGFNQFNVLTSPGDITGDGRADLIARKSSNGAVYLYKGTSAGKLSSPVKVASNWAGYKKIVGVGDLNGDGYGDLVAQDKANVLWRYSGNGKGGFKGRVKIASGWGSSYNAVVGVGDITGDGKADLVARDTSGNLYRYNGDGKGSFGGRKKIATGWKGYKGLF